MITEFNIDLYFALVEMRTVYDGGRVSVCLLDGTIWSVNLEFEPG